MSARHRFPGNEPGGDSTVLTFETTAIDVAVDEDDKYTKKTATNTASKWNFPTNHLTKQLSSFTASAITNINQTIAGASIAPSPQSTGFIQSASSSSLDLLFNRQEEEIVVMASRDRTNEFANAIRSMQGRNIQRAVNIRDPRKAKQMQSYSEFMGVAKLIGRNIASTYTKLEKLTLCELNKPLSLN